MFEVGLCLAIKGREGGNSRMIMFLLVLRRAKVSASNISQSPEQQLASETPPFHLLLSQKPNDLPGYVRKLCLFKDQFIALVGIKRRIRVADSQFWELILVVTQHSLLKTCS
ncbi:hypothetical protein V6Z98_010031 [Aspergillus fumigatus]|jgi:hypothetical protein